MIAINKFLYNQLRHLVQHTLWLATLIQHCLDRNWFWHSSLALVVPTDQRRKTDDKAENPSSEDQKFGSLWGHDVGVGDGVRDGNVPVKTDDDQMEDGRRTHPYVDREPDGAPDVAEQPQVKNLVHGWEGKHDETEHKIGTGQRDDEEVGGAPQLVRVEDGNDDHHVAENDDQADEAEWNQGPDDERVLEVDVVERAAAVVQKPFDTSIVTTTAATAIC